MQRVREQLEVPSLAAADGSGITVGVLDTGIGQHPDLSGRLLRFQDFVGYKNRMYDDNGHGTHVCGILCGSGAVSQERYRGMAPGVRLIVGKVLDDKGDGSTESMNTKYLSGHRYVGRNEERGTAEGKDRRSLGQWYLGSLCGGEQRSGTGHHFRRGRKQ